MDRVGSNSNYLQHHPNNPNNLNNNVNNNNDHAPDPHHNNPQHQAPHHAFQDPAYNHHYNNNNPNLARGVPPVMLPLAPRRAGNDPHHPHLEEDHHENLNDDDDDEIEMENDGHNLHAAGAPQAPPPPAVPNVNEIVENEDGVIEAGVALPLGFSHPLDGVGGAQDHHNPHHHHPHSHVSKPSTECDLVVLIHCQEDLQQHPNSVAKQGATLSIGFEKSTKLQCVFSHFARFCSAQTPHEPIDTDELEFVHHEVLSGLETAEGSALMKNDVIKVRRGRPPSELELAQEINDARNQSDQRYVQQMRTMLLGDSLASSSTTASCPKTKNGADLILRCGVPGEPVEAHLALLRLRCPWLYHLARRAQFSICNANHHYNHHLAKTTRAERVDVDEDDKENFVVASSLEGLRGNLYPFLKQGGSRNEPQKGFVIEQEDEPGPGISDTSTKRRRMSSDGSSIVAFPEVMENSGSGRSNARVISMGSSPAEATGKHINNTVDCPTVVVLEEHSPESVRLLLEYCYTDRCLALGREGIPNPDHNQLDRVKVSMEVLLDSLALATIANLPRFGTMCEVAASRLLTCNNILAVLCQCNRASAKEYSFLRKEATKFFFLHITDEAIAVGMNGGGRSASAAVPALIRGVREVVDENPKKLRERIERRRQFDFFSQGHEQDDMDRIARDRERKKIRDSREYGKRRRKRHHHSSFSQLSQPPHPQHHKNRKQPHIKPKRRRRSPRLATVS